MRIYFLESLISIIDAQCGGKKGKYRDITAAFRFVGIADVADTALFCKRLI